MLTPTRALAVARTAVGLATLFMALETYVLLEGVAQGRFALPAAGWVPAPTPATVSAYLLVAVCAGLAITVGFRVALAATVSTVLGCWILLWDQQTYSNHHWLALLLVALLIPAHRRQRPRAPREPAGGVSLPSPGVQQTLVLMKVQLTVCYAFAALSKLNPAFLRGEPLADSLRWELPSWMLLLMAVGTVVTELFLAVGLWFARTRRLAVAAGVALHVCIVLMIGQETPALVAFSLTCLGVYPLFCVRAQDEDLEADGVAGAAGSRPVPRAP